MNHSLTLITNNQTICMIFLITSYARYVVYCFFRKHHDIIYTLWPKNQLCNSYTISHTYPVYYVLLCNRFVLISCNRKLFSELTWFLWRLSCLSRSKHGSGSCWNRNVWTRVGRIPPAVSGSMLQSFGASLEASPRLPPPSPDLEPSVPLSPP